MICAACAQITYELHKSQVDTPTPPTDNEQYSTT